MFLILPETPVTVIVSKPGILRPIQRRLASRYSIGWPIHKVLIVGTVAVLAGYLVLDKGRFFRQACDIKGNVSYYGGQRIYHLPGDYYYHQTTINPAKGEKWFCSEIEAWLHGFRHARPPRQSGGRSKRY